MSDAFALETSQWDQLAERHYRKRELYSLEWPIEKFDLAKYSVSAAANGGPLAVTLDPHKLVNVASAGIGVDQVHVFSASAVRLAAFGLKKALGRLVTVGWSDAEQLVVVLDDGTVQLYSLLGQLVREFQLGGVCASQGVAACRVYGRGLIALTMGHEFVALSSLDGEPRVRQLASANLSEPPSAWELVEPRYTLSGSVEVLVATQTGTIVVIDSDGAQDQLLSNGPFERLAVAPGGKFVACFAAHSGALWVASVDFKTSIVTFDTKSARVPTQLVWCGADSVVMSWPELLLMVGPGGQWIKYAYDGEPAVFLAPEIDGIRVFTNGLCEFLQRVPDATEAIFKIGSAAPAALLFDATEHFYSHSPKADELIRAIGADLADAVDVCIEAAGHERKFAAQRALLRAASFGKAFVDSYDADKLVKMCKALRVLNAMAHHEVGLPMTHAQLRAVGSRGAVARLTTRHMHLLALRVAKHLGQRPDAVLVHWACAKVRAARPDAQLGEEIVAKLSQAPGVSYVEVASTAYRLGKVELATLLLEHEPHAADQVPLLIGMGEAELALRKAIASGDTDLVYLVLLHLKRTAPPAAFFAALKDKPVAMALLIAYCKEQGKEQDLALLQDIYYALNRVSDSAHVKVREAYARTDLTERVAGLQGALEVYRDAKDVFHAQATEDQIRLLLLQREIEAELGKGAAFVGKSLGDTIYDLFATNDPAQHKRATKLAKEFKVPEKRLWHTRLAAAVAAKDWEGLAQLAKEKKSPIGYTPFAEACIAANAAEEAKKYIARCAEVDERIDLYLRIKAFKDAATVAREAKNAEQLQRVRDACPNDRQTQSLIEQFLTELNSK
jgi:hypothetical protein